MGLEKLGGRVNCAARARKLQIREDNIESTASLVYQQKKCDP